MTEKIRKIMMHPAMLLFVKMAEPFAYMAIGYAFGRAAGIC